jgi:Spy/CpxP family protein refolding chaperone
MKMLLLTLAISLGTTANILAQAPIGPSAFQNGFGLAAMFAQLDLTDDQERDIAIVLRDNRDAMKAALGNVADSRENLMSYVRNDVYDEEAVRAAYADVSAAGEVAVLLRARLTADIRSRLTAEQLDTIDSFRDDRKSRLRGVISRIRDRVRSWIDEKAAG